MAWHICCAVGAHAFDAGRCDAFGQGESIELVGELRSRDAHVAAHGGQCHHGIPRGVAAELERELRRGVALAGLGQTERDGTLTGVEIEWLRLDHGLHRLEQREQLLFAVAAAQGLGADAEAQVGQGLRRDLARAMEGNGLLALCRQQEREGPRCQNAFGARVEEFDEDIGREGLCLCVLHHGQELGRVALTQEAG